MYTNYVINNIKTFNYVSVTIQENKFQTKWANDENILQGEMGGEEEEIEKMRK